jgi:hypothetical protein
MTEFGFITQQLRWLNADRRRMLKGGRTEAFHEKRLQELNAKILALKIRRDSFRPKWSVNSQLAT